MIFHEIYESFQIKLLRIFQFGKFKEKFRKNFHNNSTILFTNYLQFNK